MTKDETADVAIRTELDRRFADAATLVPASDVSELKMQVEELQIESDADLQTATNMGVRVASMVTKIEGFWESWREHYFRRYKAIMAITKDGLTTEAHQITGVASLAEIRKSIEHKMRAYKIQREKETATRQRSMDKIVANNVSDINSEIERLLLEGDFAEARKLRHEAENIHPVAIMRQEVKLEGADVRQPYKWALDPEIPAEEALMKVIKAIAAGEVALMHSVTVKGKTEHRSIVDLSTVVLNQKTREMGPELHIPGIAVTRDVSFAFSRTAV